MPPHRSSTTTPGCDHLSPKQLAAHEGSLLLFPGVAWALARLTGLLKPLIETIWVADVRRWNKHLSADVPDIAGHLFGRDRISLKPARNALLEAYGPGCFYSQTVVGTSGAADHVLPWRRIGIDGLTNLVVACQRCNSDKATHCPGRTSSNRPSRGMPPPSSSWPGPSTGLCSVSEQFWPPVVCTELNQWALPFGQGTNRRS